MGLGFQVLGRTIEGYQLYRWSIAAFDFRFRVEFAGITTAQALRFRV